MLTDNSSFTSSLSNQTKKRRRRASLYFSSSRALKRSRMTKGRKTVSRSNDSTSENIRKALRFGGGEGGRAEDVYAANQNALEPIIEDIAAVSNQAQPAEISVVREFVLPLNSRHFILGGQLIYKHINRCKGFTSLHGFFALARL